ACSEPTISRKTPGRSATACSTTRSLPAFSLSSSPRSRGRRDNHEDSHADRLRNHPSACGGFVVLCAAGARSLARHGPRALVLNGDLVFERPVLVRHHPYGNHARGARLQAMV